MSARLFIPDEVLVKVSPTDGSRYVLEYCERAIKPGDVSDGDWSAMLERTAGVMRASATLGAIPGSTRVFVSESGWITLVVEADRSVIGQMLASEFMGWTEGATRDLIQLLADSASVEAFIAALLLKFHAGGSQSSKSE